MYALLPSLVMQIWHKLSALSLSELGFNCVPVPGLLVVMETNGAGLSEQFHLVVYMCVCVCVCVCVLKHSFSLTLSLSPISSFVKCHQLSI